MVVRTSRLSDRVRSDGRDYLVLEKAGCNLDGLLVYLGNLHDQLYIAGSRREVADHHALFPVHVV